MRGGAGQCSERGRGRPIRLGHSRCAPMYHHCTFPPKFHMPGNLTRRYGISQRIQNMMHLASHAAEVNNNSSSGSEDDEDQDDNVWDDRKLNDAYDKALKIANAEVARRIAMSTNTPPKDKPGDSKNVKDKPKQSTSKGSKKDTKWKVGMPCRAIYDEDGMEYEATIQTIMKGQECVIKFVGYDNSQVVSLATLRPSLGKEAQMRQIEQAIQDKTDDEYVDPISVPDSMEIGSSKGGKSPPMENIDGYVNRAASPNSNTDDRSFNRGPKVPKKKKKKNQNQRHMNGFNLPDMAMPNFNNMLMNGSVDMPLPPPPPLGFPGSINVDSEDQAVSSMLLSWYMSGYYTGLYQGLKRARENRRNQ